MYFEAEEEELEEPSQCFLSKSDLMLQGFQYRIPELSTFQLPSVIYSFHSVKVKTAGYPP